MSTTSHPPERALVVHGLSNCDTVRRARAWLVAQGAQHEFHDFKRAGLPSALLDGWLQRLGWAALLNRQGLTWKKLDFELRETIVDAASARELMLKSPSVIRRPVVTWPDGTLTVGFDEERWAGLLHQLTATGSAPCAT